MAAETPIRSTATPIWQADCISSRANCSNSQPSRPCRIMWCRTGTLPDSEPDRDSGEKCSSGCCSVLAPIAACRCRGPQVVEDRQFRSVGRQRPSDIREKERPALRRTAGAFVQVNDVEQLVTRPPPDAGSAMVVDYPCRYRAASRLRLPLASGAHTGHHALRSRAGANAPTGG